MIVFTLFSLLGFGGLEVGLSGPVLAGALTAEEMNNLVTAPGVEAIIIISAGHKIELIPGTGISFRKPIDRPDGEHVPENKRPDTPTPTPHNQLPVALQYEIPPGPFKKTSIELYGDKTCILWGGIYYCWP